MGIFEQFPYLNFHEMNQDWIIRTVKELVGEFVQLKLDWSELQTWIMSYFNSLDLSAEIRKAVKDQVDEMYQDGTLTTMISQAIAAVLPQFSAPVFVDSTDDMTDPRNVYVLTSDGHVYAYNGSAFYDTGLVYNLDASDWISNLGALTTGTDLDDVDDADGYYYLSSSSSYDNMPPNVAAGLLLVTKQGTVVTQLLTGVNANQLTRHKVGAGSWTTWNQTGMGNNGVIPNYGDFNDYIQPGYWLMNGSYTYANGPEWLTGSAAGLLFVSASGTYVQQLAIRANGQATIRRKSGSSWSSWSALAAGNNGMLPYQSDLNDLITDGYWYLNGVSEALYEHMPVGSPSGNAAFLTIKHYNSIITQVLENMSGVEFFRRSYNAGSTWTDWITTSVKSSSESGSGKYIAFGDSLMWGSIWTEEGGERVITRAPVGAQMPTKIAYATGMQDNFANAAVGNMAYVAYQGYPLDNTMVQEVAATDLTGCALITLGGGRNDGSNSLTSVMSAIETIIQDIQDRAPKCQIVLTQPTPHNQSNSQDPFTYKAANDQWSLNEFEEAAKTLCAQYGVAYVGWKECTYMRSWASFTGADGNYAHPNNQESYEIMGAYIAGRVAQYFRY